MDVSKYPLERLFYFAAGVIPGFTALLIYQVTAPGSFQWFFTLGFLGYKTKLTLMLVAAFIVGNCMNTFLGSLTGAIGGAVGAILAQRPLKSSTASEIAPWRDTRWRSLAKKQLGVHAPDDTNLMSTQIFNQRCELAKLSNPDRQSIALMELAVEKGKTELDDLKWESWYDHYHQIILNPENIAVEWYVQNGFSANMQTTAVYVLISVAIIPSLRRWWCILPSIMWILIGVAQAYSIYKRFSDKWSTLSDQIKYLSRAEPL